MIAFAIGELTIRVVGLGEAEERELLAQWGNFRVPGADAPWIEARITHLPAAPLEPFDAKRLRVEPGGDAFVVSMPGARAVVPDSGALSIGLEGEAPGRNALATINVLHATIAWRIVGLGGLMLHAASAVVEGRAFALVGAEGAGKSTWARGMRDAGAVALGDDIALVLPGRSGFDLIGSPLRAKEFGGGTPGRWPLAAILVPRHAGATALDPVSLLHVQAVLAANVPFAVDRADLAAAYGRAVSGLASVEARRLSFRPGDPGAAQLASLSTRT